MRKGLKTYKTILKAAKYCIIYFFISTTKIIHFNPIFVNLLFLWIKINNDYRTNSALRIQRFLYHHPATCYKKYLTIQKTKKKAKNLKGQVLNPAPIKTSEQLNGMHAILFCFLFLFLFFIFKFMRKSWSW